METQATRSKNERSYSKLNSLSPEKVATTRRATPSTLRRSINRSSLDSSKRLLEQRYHPPERTTDSQLESIQKPVINALLPKAGYVRMRTTKSIRSFFTITPRVGRKRRAKGRTAHSNTPIKRFTDTFITKFTQLKHSIQHVNPYKDNAQFTDHPT